MRSTLLLLPLLIACGAVETHSPEEHAAHGDKAHGDKAHGDKAHGDKAHGDKAHGDKGDHGHDHGAGGHDHGDAAAAMGMKKPADGAKVMFLEPADGATVKSPVKVKMGVEGMKVQPAGQLTDGTGHHHIIIDATTPAFGTAVPADETHIHFGKGQTEVDLELKPGKHTLSLQFADGTHRSYGKAMATSITVTVE